MTHSRRTGILERWVAAYNAHDIDALIALADPKIAIVPLGYTVTAPPGTSYHGHEGIRSLLEPGFARYPRLQMETAGETVIGSSTVASVTLVLDDGEGQPVRRTGAGLFVFQEERVSFIRTFTTEQAARVAAAHGVGVLTPREREVLSLVARGLTAKQIAARLAVSPLTVRSHLRNAKRKVGGRTTSHAIAIVLQDKCTAIIS